MSPVVEGIELLLPWQSPGVKASFSTIAYVLTARGKLCLSSVSIQNNESWTYAIYYHDLL
jgi:hypothetical protein